MFRKNLSRILNIGLLVVFILFSGFKNYQTYDTNARIKAVFIYNFAKYIQWPSNYKDGPFIIGVFGESNVLKELNKMAKMKKINNRPLKVVQYKDIADIEKCHILYVPKKYSDEFNAINKKLKSQSTVVITENEGLLDKGAGINFVVINNRQKFEINKTLLKKKKLKVSNDLDKLAVRIK
ncbi:MAG TPA: DUF4154 domain-containing protein [Flavobacteriales bacterium]|nr:DUF4154 domain-containing protein [Flavobacteriales bacterium]